MSTSKFSHRYTTKTSGEFTITTGRKVEVVGTFKVDREKGKVNTSWENREVLGRANDVVRRDGIKSVNAYVRSEILNKSETTVMRNDKVTETKDKGTKDTKGKDMKGKDMKGKETKGKDTKGTKGKDTKGTKDTKTKGAKKSTPPLPVEVEEKDPFRVEFRKFEANDRKSKTSPWFVGEMWIHDQKRWLHVANVSSDGKGGAYQFEVLREKEFTAFGNWVMTHPDVKRFKAPERLEVFLEDAVGEALKYWEVTTKFVAKAIRDGITLWRLDYDPEGYWRESGKWTKKVHNMIRSTAKKEHAAIEAILAPQKSEPKLYERAIKCAVRMYKFPE